MTTPTEIRVSGMHCQSCVRRLEKALGGVPDATVLSVEVGLVAVELATPAARKKVEEAISSAGYVVDG